MQKIMNVCCVEKILPKKRSLFEELFFYTIPEVVLRDFPVSL